MATEPTQTGAQIKPRDGISHVRGATDIALSDATVSRFLLETANRFLKLLRVHQLDGSLVRLNGIRELLGTGFFRHYDACGGGRSRSRRRRFNSCGGATP